MEKFTIYENCISLGWYCGTASSLAFNGLRNFSGPFDWCVSSLESVLRMLETDFKDFLLKENLEITQCKSIIFQDKSNGFLYYHDLEVDFEDEYEGIYKKYIRRIERFRAAIKTPTCFFRVVRSDEEVDYIEKNKEYIYNVIKKGNSCNDIIFLIRKGIKPISQDFVWYQLNVDEYPTDFLGMSLLFSKTTKLADLCERQIMNEKAKYSNMKHKSVEKIKAAYFEAKLKQKNDDIKCAIKLLVKQDDVYVWGAGVYGKMLVKYMREHNIDIKAIIDNDPKKISLAYSNIPIIAYESITQKKDIAILVSVINKEVEETIVNTIKNNFDRVNVIIFDDIYRRIEWK